MKTVHVLLISTLDDEWPEVHAYASREAALADFSTWENVREVDVEYLDMFDKTGFDDNYRTAMLGQCFYNEETDCDCT